MDRQKPNKFGVYTKYENIKVPLPSSVKGELTIHVACCQDGKYRTGWHYQIKTEGGGGLPSAKGQPFDTMQQAVMHVAEGFLDKYEHATRMDEKHRKVIVRAIENFIISNSETEGDDLLCGNETCAFRAECMKQPPDPDAMCLAKIAAKKKKPGYLFGWKHGGDGHQLYVYRSLPSWGVTDTLDDAYRFGSIQECIDSWRSTNAYPEQSEHCIWDGYLQFFKESKTGIKQVLAPLQQLTLF